ncbi:uncharacterized protein LOC142355030 [Convolutriloba macropyga]|uniref:uncharacterized protein LOC142355030 n=1 Tax=Convolutriloba macropyga TaxID=536237 RepID=UPI003F51AF35
MSFASSKGHHGAIESPTLLAENSILLQEIAGMRRQLAEQKAINEQLQATAGEPASAESDGMVERLLSEVSNWKGHAEALEQQNKNLSFRIEELEERGRELEEAESASGFGSLRKQVQEFTLNKQLELEKQLTSASTRATLAEEQMEEMQKYMAQSTASYQKVFVPTRHSQITSFKVRVSDSRVIHTSAVHHPRSIVANATTADGPVPEQTDHCIPVHSTTNLGRGRVNGHLDTPPCRNPSQRSPRVA